MCGARLQPEGLGDLGEGQTRARRGNRLQDSDVPAERAVVAVGHAASRHPSAAIAPHRAAATP